MSSVFSVPQNLYEGVKRSAPLRLEELISAHAVSTPEALAVIEAEPSGQIGRALTYGDLDTRSTEIAYLLISLGVTPGSLVAFCMERGIDAIAALLGIIKAGATYLPLDPAYLWPNQQLSQMLDEAQVQLLLAHSSTMQQMRALGLSQSLLNVEDVPALQALCEDGVPLPSGASPLLRTPVSAERIAQEPLCVMYTSGSTGFPKGVVIPHRGVGRLVLQANYLIFSPEMRVASTSSLGFDASLFEVFGPLLNGATIVVIPRARVLLPNEAADLFRTYGVDVAFLTTSIFHRYASVAPWAFGRMDSVIFGGETADPAAVARILQSPTPPRRLLNVYGPSENTTFSTFFEVPRSGVPAGEALPIGVPLLGTQVYVLDEQQRVVHSGEEGEIYVGGHGVALGYLHRPDLTASAFIQHPEFGRLYKTGDRGCWRPDGNLEFRGRQDGQLKLNGFRVESEALALALRSHPLVREAAVALVRESQRAPSLAAYLVLSSPCEDEGALLRDVQNLMSSSFPAQQVPTAYYLVPALPLTASGKIDGRLLSAPDRVTGARRLGPGAVPQQALSQHEELIRQISSKVLEVPPEHIDVELPLREYGLDSLRMSIYAAALEERFPGSSQRVLRALLTGASIRSLAPSLNATKRKQPIPLLQVTRASGTDSWVTSTSRPLLHELLTGRVPPLDGAALTYLPVLDPDQERAMALLHQGHVLVTSVVTTLLGRVGVFLLPLQPPQLYREEAVGHAVEAVLLAQACGARSVSLTGRLASATAYGKTLQHALSQRPHVSIPVTTGHGTVAAAVLLNLLRTLDTVGRDIRAETMAVVGLGSIGTSALRLALSVLPPPRELLLCDLFQRRESLEALKGELQERYRLGERCRIVESRNDWLPPEVYEASLILGASDGGEVLDVTALKPGCVVIDDSAPHCFSLARAQKRAAEQEDVLFIEGGELAPAFDQEELRFSPDDSEGGQRALEVLRSEEVRGLRDAAPRHVMSCLLASGLGSGHDLPPTLGLADLETLRQHYYALTDLGVRGAPPYLGDERWSQGYLERFRSRFRNRIARV